MKPMCSIEFGIWNFYRSNQPLEVASLIWRWRHKFVKIKSCFSKFTLVVFVVKKCKLLQLKTEKTEYVYE